MIPGDAIGPGGNYMIRLKDGTKQPLTEVLRDDRDHSGYQLMDLYAVDGEAGRRLVLRELSDETDGIVYDTDVADTLKAAGEAIVTYGDYLEETQTFCKALLDVWSDR